MTNNNLTKFYDNHKGGNQVEKNSQNSKESHNVPPKEAVRQQHGDRLAKLNTLPLTNKGVSFVIILVSAAIIMLGLSYVSVPLYQIWCSSRGLKFKLEPNNATLPSAMAARPHARRDSITTLVDDNQSSEVGQVSEGGE